MPRISSLYTSSLLQPSCTMSHLGSSQNQALSVQAPNLKQGDSIVLKGPAGIMMRSLNSYILALFPPSPPNYLTPYGLACGKQPSKEKILPPRFHLWLSWTSRVHLAYYTESKREKGRSGRGGREERVLETYHHCNFNITAH